MSELMGLQFTLFAVMGMGMLSAAIPAVTSAAIFPWSLALR